MSDPKTYIRMGEDVVDAALVTVPSNRDFRDAWQLSGTVIEINMSVARNVQRDKIRQARKVAFTENDIAINDALLSGVDADKAAAIARRDELRDAPAHADIEAASTPDELSAVWPCGLSYDPKAE